MQDLRLDVISMNRQEPQFWRERRTAQQRLPLTRIPRLVRLSHPERPGQLPHKRLELGVQLLDVAVLYHLAEHLEMIRQLGDDLAKASAEDQIRRECRLVVRLLDLGGTSAVLKYREVQIRRRPIVSTITTLR